MVLGFGAPALVARALPFVLAAGAANFLVVRQRIVAKFGRSQELVAIVNMHGSSVGQDAPGPEAGPKTPPWAAWSLASPMAHGPRTRAGTVAVAAAAELGRRAGRCRARCEERGADHDRP
jgi:hypothetical protein